MPEVLELPRSQDEGDDAADIGVVLQIRLSRTVDEVGVRRKGFTDEEVPELIREPSRRRRMTGQRGDEIETVLPSAAARAGITLPPLG